MLTFNVNHFAQDFLPGLPHRAVESRIKAGVLPVELTADGEMVAEPRSMTALTVCLPLMGRRSRGLPLLALWQRVIRGLTEAELQGPGWRCYLVMDRANGWSGCFLTDSPTAPRPEPGHRVIDLSAIEAKWKDALARASRFEDLIPEREKLLQVEA